MSLVFNPLEFTLEIVLGMTGWSRIIERSIPMCQALAYPSAALMEPCIILAKAIEMAGILGREKLRNTIGKVEMMTVRGPIKFRENGSAMIKYGFRQWQDGKNVRYTQKKWPSVIFV